MVGQADVFLTTPVDPMLARLYGGLQTGMVSFFVYLRRSNTSSLQQAAATIGSCG